MEPKNFASITLTHSDSDRLAAVHLLLGYETEMKIVLYGRERERGVSNYEISEVGALSTTAYK